MILGNALLIFSQQLDLVNLKGIKDIVFFMDVNGVTYRRGYTSVRDREPKDFNLEKMEKQLNADRIPLKADYFRKLYESGVAKIKKSPIRIKEIYRGESSIIPFLRVSVEVKKISADLFGILAQLIVSDRLWIYPGVEKKSTAYIWYKKEWLFLRSEDLKSRIQVLIDQMVSGFIDDCKKTKLKK
jgi:hypothetical protein